MPFSPLGRGLLTGALTGTEALEPGDLRRHQPRFDAENLDANLALVDRVKAVAAEKGCTPGQLALAWLVAQGDDVVPIPGTKRRRYLEENVAALDVKLTDDELARISEAAPLGAAVGDRYRDLSHLDT